MSIRERVADWLLADQKGRLPGMNGRSIASRHAIPTLSEFTLQVQQGLYQNSAVQGCIQAMVKTMSEAPLVVRKPDGSIVPNHPVTALFRKPNPAMSYAQFMKHVSTYIGTGGEVFIHKVRSELDDRVIELYPYHSGQMTPVPSEWGWISHFNYMYNGEVRPVPAEDVVHIKWMPDPLNPIRSLSPVEIAGRKVQTLNELDTTVYSVMKNNGIPGHIMFLPYEPTEKQKSSIRKMWKDKFSGTDRGDLAVMHGDIKVEKLAQDMNQLSAEGLYGQLESAICGVYQIHPAVAMVYAGLLSSTYSNMETAFREFTSLFRIPTWKDWADQISLGFSDELGLLQAWFDTSDLASLNADAEQIGNTVSQWTSNLITQNEAREQLGWDATPTGNQYYSEATASEAGAGFLSQSASDELEGAYDGKKWRFTDEKAGLKAWKKIDEVNQTHTKRMMPFVQDMIQEAGKMAGSQKAGPNAGNIDVDKLLRRFMRSSGALRRKLMEEIIALAIADAGTGIDFSAIQSHVDKIADQASRQVQSHMKKAVEETKRQISETIASNRGKSVAEIAEAVREKVKGMSEGRAKAIAQTTTTAQTSTTQKSTWKTMNDTVTDPGDELLKVWISRRDSKVRDSHEDLDGTVVELDQDFAPGIEAPGIASEAKDAVNCRCAQRTVKRSRLR